MALLKLCLQLCALLHCLLSLLHLVHCDGTSNFQTFARSLHNSILNIFSVILLGTFIKEIYNMNKVSQTYSSFQKVGLLLAAVDLEDLFKGLNIYRNSHNQLALTENSKVKCIAEQIVKNLYDQLPCSHENNGDPLIPSNQSQLPLFTHYSRKCEVNLNHTVDGVILPVYVPSSANKLMLTGCTHSQAPKYLSNETFTRVGLATNKDCLVIALGTDAVRGSYSAGVSLVPNIGWVYGMGLLFLGRYFFQ